MKDYIKYSGENLAAASSQLGRLSNTMSDIADMLSAVDTSGGWWSKIGLRTGYGDAREAVQAGRRDAGAIRQKTENTISGIEKTRAIFEEVEQNVDLGGAGRDQSIYQAPGNGGAASGAETGAPATSTDKKVTSKFWDALVKAVGGSSGIGKVLEGLYGAFTAEDGVSLGKGITKIVQGTHSAAKEIPDWIKNWNNYKPSSFEEAFDKGITKASTWIFSGVTAAFDTYTDIQNGRYASTDDYVVKWASRTAADVVIKTTVKAGVTTAVTAGAAALGIAAGGWVPLAAGAATAVVIYGGDCLVKWASDGAYSGMTDVISDYAVKTWDKTKTKWKSAWSFWSKTVESVVPAF